MAIFIDKRTGAQRSLNPYFEAGKATPFLSNDRDEGVKVSGSAFVSAMDENVSVQSTASGTPVTISEGASGIQGFVKYQANVELLIVPVQ